MPNVLQMEERHIEKVEHYRSMLRVLVKGIRRYIKNKKVNQAQKNKEQFRKLWKEYKEL
tara:strand:- start:694 stop:870 length:177 start_codon:yes stop_codon:yes gene_type:complete